MNYQNRIFYLLMLFFLNVPITRAGTSTLELTVTTTLQPSTCEATLVNASDTLITAVDIGDVNINDVVNKTKFKPFMIRFSQCEGLLKNTATIRLEKKTGCDGDANNGAGYRNALIGADNATGVSAEIWTETAAGNSSGSGIQLSCVNPPVSTVDLKAQSGATSVYWPLSTRIVTAQDKTSDDIGPGAFSTLATFTIQYE